MLYCILIAGWMTTLQCLPQSVSQSEQTTFSRRPALFLLAAPSSRVNSASWRLTLRQILPANRRLVSVSSTQLPRDERRNYRLDFKHAGCGGCTKTRRLQEGFFTAFITHHRPPCCCVSASGVHEFSHCIARCRTPLPPPPLVFASHI